MTIIKSVMYGNFGSPTSRDRGLTTQKTTKNGHFFVENLLIYNYKMLERGTLKFEHDLGEDKTCIRTKFGGAQLRDCESRGR